ncbi:hypothetical protein Pmani_008741 [Petrolisthes manimaculis]|uniref:Uncharacterized protein n=1 Tax=Petrolisthes manimaculis TaxID=1843537 RepID=A0AAE1UIL5_9EUCA|nr:hypothetical protein Pmani_008741 [Petrolisthes manimaculis]
MTLSGGETNPLSSAISLVSAVSCSVSACTTLSFLSGSAKILSINSSFVNLVNWFRWSFRRSDTAFADQKALSTAQTALHTDPVGGHHNTPSLWDLHCLHTTICRQAGRGSENRQALADSLSTPTPGRDSEYGLALADSLSTPGRE